MEYFAAPGLIVYQSVVALGHGLAWFYHYTHNAFAVGGYLFFASWLVTVYHVYDNRWYHQRREQRERFVSTMRKGLKIRRRKSK